MKFDPYFITAYLHRHFLIPPEDVTWYKHLKKDFMLSDDEIRELLIFLDVMSGLDELTKRPSRFEYVIDLVFYYVLNELSNDSYPVHD